MGAYSILVQWEYVRPSVRTYILTLERGDRSGYLILLPLVHMFKVMDDGVHMSYALPRGIGHMLYDVV